MKVNLFLDIPLSLYAGLSKRALRQKDVNVDGAGWPTSLIYCTKCGWMERRLNVDKDRHDPL